MARYSPRPVRPAPPVRPGQAGIHIIPPGSTVAASGHGPEQGNSGGGPSEPGSAPALAAYLAGGDPAGVVGGGTTADGVPFMVRAPDGTSIELATTGQTKPRQAAKADASSFREAGSASPSPFTSQLRLDQNSALMGSAGLARYREMKRESAPVRSGLRAVKTPIESARWGMMPGADTPIAKKQAEFCAENLFNNLDVTWSQTLADILMFLEYGYSMLHKVYIRQTGTGGGPRIVLSKLAPRHPMDVEHIEYDDFGSPMTVFFYPAGAYQQRPDGRSYPMGGGGGGGQNVPVEIKSLAVFTLDGEAGDLQGTSVLRSAYGHWMIRNAMMRIDAIQKERHSIGVPVITLPPGAGPAELALAEEMGRNLRTNERAHVVLPNPNWKIEMVKLEGQPVDPCESMDWHTEQIYKSVLYPGLGDRAPDKTEDDLFLKSTKYIADRIADTMNKWVVRELVDYNWANTKPNTYPLLTARWIGEFEDARTRSFAVRNYSGAGMITPDDVLEAALRKELDLPPADLATRRLPPTPQDGTEDEDGEDAKVKVGPDGKPIEEKSGPGSKSGKQSGAKAGQPRQAKPPTGKPKPNGGTDRSGGN